MAIIKHEDRNLKTHLRQFVIANKEFKAIIQAVNYNIGIKEPVDEADIDRIFLYLTRNFGNIALEEVNLAFELYASQQLNFKDSHFQSFDLVFIGKVLTSFIQYKQDKTKRPKLIEVGNPNPTSAEELERCYFWVDFNFHDESERNGKRGTFPDIIICSWKNAYQYMINEGMIEPLTGEALTERVKEAAAILRTNEKDRAKRLSNAFNSKITNEDSKTMEFYKLEVTDYFIKNFRP